MRRQRGSHLGLLLLAVHVFQLGLDNIPPVTLGVLALNVYLSLFPVAPPLKTCVSVEQVFWFKDWRRLFLSPVHHVDEWHLYFNMVSFLWKGRRLERRLGEGWFLYLLAVFSLLTGLVYLLLEAFLAEIADDQYYNRSCAVGFSGVLFALKVLHNHYHPGGVTLVLGIPVANRYASWVELVVIDIIAPETSFAGHLAGILVGLLYTSGPLKTIMKRCAELVTWSRANSYGGPYFRSSGRSGYRGADSGNYHRTPNYSSHRTSSFTGGLTEEEQLEEAIRNSLNNRRATTQTDAAPPYGFILSQVVDPEEIRLRRLRRFDT